MLKHQHNWFCYNTLSCFIYAHFNALLFSLISIDIKIALVGVEQVEWLEKSREALLVHNDSTEKDNKVLYSDKQERLYESCTITKRTSLQAAEVCVQNFSFDLPYDAPASCIMQYGQRFYCVRVTLQCKAVSDKVYNARITVKNRVDLSAALELSEVGKRNNAKLRQNYTLYTIIYINILFNQ